MLYVYDNDLATGFPLLEFTGTKDDASSTFSPSFYFPAVFEPVRSTGQALVLLFLSDEMETGRGFNATLSVIEGMDLMVKFVKSVFEEHVVRARAWRR